MWASWKSDGGVVTGPAEQWVPQPRAQSLGDLAKGRRLETQKCQCEEGQE